MARINQDFEIYAGEDKQINFTVLDETNQPVDLENSNAIWVLANILATPQILITKTVVDGGIIIENNVYQVLVDAADTSELKSANIVMR